jgi:hypothetical protein
VLPRIADCVRHISAFLITASGYCLIVSAIAERNEPDGEADDPDGGRRYRRWGSRRDCLIEVVRQSQVCADSPIA